MKLILMENNKSLDGVSKPYFYSDTKGVVDNIYSASKFVENDDNIASYYLNKVRKNYSNCKSHIITILDDVFYKDKNIIYSLTEKQRNEYYNKLYS